MRLSKRGYPQLTRPRWRFRRPHHFQDTVVLELQVPAAMIPWLTYFAGWFGPGVERCAVFFLTSHLMQSQESMAKGAYGGLRDWNRVLAEVDQFLAEPVNSGPGAQESEAFAATLAEIHPNPLNQGPNHE